jgi:hypothetical protein
MGVIAMSDIYIARARNTAFRQFGGEMMIMSAANSNLFTLNEPGSRIWAAADGRTPLRRIVRDNICSEFDVAPDQAYSDAWEFATRLARHGLVELSPRPLPAS